MTRLAAVVIGRNEAAKLERCLTSVARSAAPVVFVDSASEDRSVELARALRVDVVELDPALPFTVARSRNAGLQRALEMDPSVELVQFTDGDSEMVGSWFEHACKALDEDPRLAVVYGRVRERDCRKSIYARLYEADFRAHFNQDDTCAGISMMRVSAFQQIGGFNSTLLGCEDFELSFRMRRAGWGVRRLPVEMAVHEAGMTRWTQWWQRQVRAGYVRGHEAALHAGSPERYSLREYLSVCFWGLLLPLLALAAAAWTDGASLWLFAAYPALFLRIVWRTQRRGSASIDAAVYAAACVLGKFPQGLGLLRFHAQHLSGQVQLRAKHS